MKNFLRGQVTRGDLIAIGLSVLTMFFIGKLSFMNNHSGRQFLVTIVVFIILDTICNLVDYRRQR